MPAPGMSFRSEVRRGRNPWAQDWRFLLGAIVEYCVCRRRGHLWKQMLVGDIIVARFDALNEVWITCTRCAACIEVPCDDWDTLNTPLHQAIRKAL